MKFEKTVWGTEVTILNKKMMLSQFWAYISLVLVVIAGTIYVIGEIVK